jgi:ribose transport system ATP-binding protein
MSGIKISMVAMRNISKNFFGTKALQNVNFDVNKGEVHVLFGENGAGKSTLMSILAGVVKATSGGIFIEGEVVSFNSVVDAKNHGIGTVFQEFSLIPTLSVAENIFLKDEPSKRGVIAKKKLKTEAVKLLETLGFTIDVHRKVSSLTRAEQQMIEIAKVFKTDAKVLILDEPTASLTDKEVTKLFEFIVKAKSKGVGIVYISHRIQEFREIADRVTVLRDGQLVGTFLIDSISDKELIESMSGRVFEKIYPSILKSKDNTALLSLRKFKPKGLGTVNIEVKKGEVLGISGLVGSGKSRVWRSVMGLHPVDQGAVFIKGEQCLIKHTSSLLRKGVYYLPPDRKKEGLQLLKDTRDNVKTNVLLRKDVISKFGFIKRAKQTSIAAKASSKSDIKTLFFREIVSKLSGGNQQKILFAKGLVSSFSIYILDEPTVGVDVGTRAVIYQLIKELVEEGKAVILISSDLLEVVNLSHRVLVFAKGNIVSELTGDEINEKNILNSFF